MGFFGQIPRSRIAGSYGSCIFSFLRNFHTIFHSGCTNLHSYQQHTRVPFSLHPHQHLLFMFFLIAILTGVRWYFTEVIIFNSLMISNAECLFMCLLVICISSLENCLFSSSAHFFNHIVVIFFLFFFFLMLSCICVIYKCWILAPYQSYYLQVFYPIQQVVFSFCDCVMFIDTKDLWEDIFIFLT